MVRLCLREAWPLLLPRMDEQWDTELAPTTHALLHELGRHYAPFLVANAEALARGEDRLECTRVFLHQPQQMKLTRTHLVALEWNWAPRALLLLPSLASRMIVIIVHCNIFAGSA